MEKIASTIQDLFANINIAGVEPFWLVAGFLVVVILIMWFTLERHKMAMVMLALYAIGLVILHTSVGTNVTKYLDEQELNYAQIAWAFLPVVALGILSIKKRKRRRSAGRV